MSNYFDRFLLLDRISVVIT